MTFRKKPCAVWRDGRGQKQRAPLSDDGEAIVVEAKYYTIEYFNHEGRRERVGTKIADRDAARQLANGLEAKAEQRRRGYIDARQERLIAEGRRTLDAHLTDYEAHLNAANRSAKHVRSTVSFIREVAKAGGFVTLADISADAVNRYVGELREQGWAARTVGARLTAIKSLTRWLTKHGKLPADPLASVQKPNPKRDRRRERRMLLPDEWRWLRSVILARGRERYGMTAAERVLLYATAIQTGLRSNELRSLTRGQLFLEAEPPYVTCKAGSTKNSKSARQYIQTDLAAELRQNVATKAPAAPVFAMPHEADVAEMLRKDLADARREWLRASQDNPDEHARRQENDFLVPMNHEGEVLDFHALRHTCGAWLAMSGAHPKAVQAVMRHSTITLTMDTYGHLFPGQEADTVARLPEMLTDPPEALRATGTVDATSAARGWAQNGAQLNGKTCAPLASRGENTTASDGEPDCRKPMPASIFGEPWRAVAAGDEARPAGLEPATCGLEVRCSVL